MPQIFVFLFLNKKRVRCETPKFSLIWKENLDDPNDLKEDGCQDDPINMIENRRLLRKNRQQNTRNYWLYI